MSEPTDDELPELIDPESIGKMATAWAREHMHSQSATLEIELRGGRYEVRMREEAWGHREIAAPPKVQPATTTVVEGATKA